MGHPFHLINNASKGIDGSTPYDAMPKRQMNKTEEYK